jgi:hypothetical protein
MDNTVLQIPMSKTLRDKATQAAKEQGFSSLQEYVRVFLTALVRGRVDVMVNQTSETSISRD